MSNRASFAALVAALTLLPTAPAHAANEIVITHAKVLAGNVTPGDPAGYPARIGASGAYVLGSNLTPPAGQTAIQIFANNVTIDLSGYTISGSAKSAWYGIVGAAGRSGATIKNGTVEEFKFGGINGAGSYWIVENMRVVRNGGTGIGNTNIDHQRVVGSTIASNSGAGVACDFFCHVEGNAISENGGTGVIITSGLVLGNSIVQNVSHGISGFAGAGYGNNTISLNNASGVQVSGGVAIHPNGCYPACP